MKYSILASTLLGLTTLASADLHDLRGAHNHHRFGRVKRLPVPEPVPTVWIPPPSNDSAIAVREGDHTKQLVKRGLGGTSGRATFYADGLGACGIYNKPNDFIVAIAFDVYGDTGAVSPHCFKYITINYGGKSARAQIVDACEACPNNGIDMSVGLFTHFADTDLGVIYVDWYEDGSGPQQPAPTTSKSTPAWTPPPTSSAQPTTHSTWSSSSSSSSIASSSSSIASHDASSSALSSASPRSTKAPSLDKGQNLDKFAQVVLGMANLVGAAAANAAQS